MKKIVFEVKNQNTIRVLLESGRKETSTETLTIGWDFDILLIRTIDKLLHKDKMGRLSLKNVQIKGKIEGKALWRMTLGAVSSALEC